VDKDPTIKMILMDGESITDIDTTALEMIEKLKAELSRSGIDLRFARMKIQLRDFLCRNGLNKSISHEHFYTSVRAGVDAYLEDYGHAKK
jgi:MFS superfamily sulfate permease-like transporter